MKEVSQIYGLYAKVSLHWNHNDRTKSDNNDDENSSRNNGGDVLSNQAYRLM